MKDLCQCFDKEGREFDMHTRAANVASEILMTRLRNDLAELPEMICLHCTVADLIGEVALLLADIDLEDSVKILIELPTYVRTSMTEEPTTLISECVH